jgi:hypothetical protein
MEHSEHERWVQLAARIPKRLQRELRLHCVRADIKLMDFITAALWEKLGRSSEAPGVTKAAEKPYGRNPRGDSSSAGRRELTAPR